MAKIVLGILGGFWKGIAYMRSLAASVSNPRTPAQLEQRAKFSTVLDFLKPLTAFLRIGFKSYAIKMSGFNAAMAYNLGNAIAGVYPAFTIDYSKVLVSHGNLKGALNPEVASAIAGQVEFTWDDNTGGAAAQADDKAMLVVTIPSKRGL